MFLHLTCQRRSHLSGSADQLVDDLIRHTQGEQFDPFVHLKQKNSYGNLQACPPGNHYCSTVTVTVALYANDIPTFELGMLQ